MQVVIKVLSSLTLYDTSKFGPMDNWTRHILEPGEYQMERIQPRILSELRRCPWWLMLPGTDIGIHEGTLRINNISRPDNPHPKEHVELYIDGELSISLAS